MKNLRNFALAAFALLGFAACQQEEFAPEIKNPTHSVTFVAGAPETKTTVDISDGATAKFAWTSEDVDRIKLYENSTPAELTQGTLTDGIMTIEAVFTGGVSTGENTYVAVLNSANDLQNLYKEAYTEDADILVSKAISSFDESKSVQLQFKREVAIAKMTLKGLDAGEVVNRVTVSSTADIAGSYGVDGWNSTKTSLDIYSAKALDDQKTYSIAANQSGEAVVWFTCIPQDAATLTVKVEAADGDTYTKEFSKPVTLTRGDVKGFGVAMVKDPKDLTFDFKNHPSGWPTSKTEALSAADYVYTLNGIDYTFSCPAQAYCGGTTETSGYLLVPSSSAMGLPAISGYKLVKVVGTLNDSGSPSTSSSISITTDGTNVVNGGTGQTWSKKGSEYTYSLVDTEEGQVYYFTVSNKNCQMIKLVLTYEPAFARPNLATPTNLAVSDEKVVSWDAVDGAASYVLTIGTEEYPCTSNYYDASAIEDEYYDVAVVAVPTDTKNYKNSAAATFTDAKFGTPTLKTPILNEGAVDEFSVNATWTVDPRATAGYNCELYNGETKVGDSKIVSTGSVTFDGLDDGVTYTVKVNAIAVEGAKAYAASGVATIDLTTKGTTKISDINAAGTYTVKNAVVYAVVNTGVVIIGDGTGLMLLEKNSHGYTVGDTFSTVAGTVAVSNGIWQFKSPTVETKTSGSAPDYGTPVEATSDYLASKPNKVVYVHARGSQSGRYITVGTEKLYMSKTNTTNDGKDVDAYGFIYGYSTQYSNTNFCVTSISEDLTAPKLSVTPTSKTWESTETGAAVFNVTTNTEGVKDWSVSPTTLGWATVAVDKNAGTITVTPKDANTAETAREAKLTVSHSAGTLSETITLTQSAAGEITINNFSQTYSYGDLTAWLLTEYTDKSSYYLIPSGDKPSVATILGIFTDKTIQSDVVITLNVATFGSGTNPSASTFSIYADSDLNTSVTATQSGTLPTSSTYTNAVYTVKQDDAASLISDLAIKITKPGKQIRLKSIKIEFSYSK